MMQRTGSIVCALILAVAAGVAVPSADAANCTTQSQLTPPQRDALAGAARNLMSEAQLGSVQAIRNNTLPAVAADFSGIAASFTGLQPLIQNASITIENVYDLDSSSDPASAQQTEFFCGSPVVMMTFNGLPPAHYGLAIVHATGVPKPQQVALILARGTDNRWLLAGIISKPLTEGGHDGLWYWVSARKFAQANKQWTAWFYYRLAVGLLSPADFLSSPNLQTLAKETDQVKPSNLPGDRPITLTGRGGTFTVTSIATTTALGPLDLDVHFTPDAAQAAQLHDPPAARAQLIDLMSVLLAQHPDLQDGFHGMWVHADQGNASIFALEVPMNGIRAGASPVAR